MNWWQENLFDSTQKLFCVCNRTIIIFFRKKNSVMKKKFHHDEKIFFINCKNNFTTFFWKIRKNSKNRDFRDLTKNGQIWSISTPPNFWPKSTHHTPNLTFSGVWWHNLCPGFWIFGGGCFLGGGSTYKGKCTREYLLANTFGG